MSAKSLFNVFAGFAYDCYRFVKYSSSSGLKGADQRSYRIVKVYHAIEKSLSFRDRNPGSGWRSVDTLVHLLEQTPRERLMTGFHEKAAAKVLSEFLRLSPPQDERTRSLANFVQTLPEVPLETNGGFDSVSLEELSRGKLDDPERFFFSRRSVRDFSPKSIDSEAIKRAIHLATSTPSVCNRQAWHVYHLDRREDIDYALSFQNGNRGFGHEVPCLLILAADLAAFDSGAERYQQWIDGGMFSMSLVMALHSVGLGSCCLNWSKGPRHDVAFRRAFAVRANHTIIMMIAVGFANQFFRVCSSPRIPVENLYTVLSRKAAVES